MKKQSGALMTRIIMIVLVLGVLAYLGVYALSWGNSGIVTTAAVKYTAQDAVTVVGYVVRDEQVLTSDREYIDVQAADGEKVAKGQVIAHTYSDSDSLERQRRIEEIRLSLEQLELMEQSSTDTSAASKVEQQIIEDLILLSQGYAEGNLSGGQAVVADLKSLVLIRNTLFSGTGDIDALKVQLQQELDMLEGQSGSTGSVSTSTSGVFSTHVDGYESLIGADDLESFTSHDFHALEQAQPQISDKAYGKMVYSSRWYFVALVDEDYASGIEEGQKLTMSFVGGYTDQIEMDVVRLAEVDSQGQCLMILSSNRNMNDTLSLRRQYVDLIDSQYTGIRIPESALRVDESGNTGVYCVSGRQARFKTVEILYTLEDYFIVSENAGSADALHVGDEIIVKGRNLYDGKVLES